MSRILATFGSRLLSGALDQVLPPRCGVCSATGRFLCRRCEATLPHAEPPRCSGCWRHIFGDMCPRCDAYGPPCAAVRAPFVYRDGAKDLVTAVKYRGMHALTADMARLLAAAWPAYEFDADVVTAVPLHPRRERSRGFNQAALLARQLAAALALPYRDDLVKRRRWTAPQARIQAHAERHNNVLGAFAPGNARLHAARVLLVDDVTTTGATFGACATALLDGGAAAVYGLAFAVAD